MKQNAIIFKTIRIIHIHMYTVLSNGLAYLEIITKYSIPDIDKSKDMDLKPKPLDPFFKI